MHAGEEAEEQGFCSRQPVPGREQRRVPVGHHQRDEQRQRHLGGKHDVLVVDRRFAFAPSGDEDAEHQPVVDRDGDGKNDEGQQQIDDALNDQRRTVFPEAGKQHRETQGFALVDQSAGIHQADRHRRDGDGRDNLPDERNGPEHGHQYPVGHDEERQRQLALAVKLVAFEKPLPATAGRRSACLHYEVGREG